MKSINIFFIKSGLDISPLINEYLELEDKTSRLFNPAAYVNLSMFKILKSFEIKEWIKLVPIKPQPPVTKIFKLIFFDIN